MAESTAQRLGFMKFLEDHANQELQILTRMETASLRIEAALAELAAQSRKSQQEVSWRTRQPKVERE
jgi:hypothetical protein